MIKLTQQKPKMTIWLNPDHILFIGADEYGWGAENPRIVTFLNLPNEKKLWIEESPEEVARKVLEWRLAMVRYGASYAKALNHDESDAELALDMNIDDLKELAGTTE